QAACQGIRRVPSGGIGECRTSKLNSRSNGFQLTALFTLGHVQVLWRFTQMSLSGFGVLAVGRKVTNPFIYLPIAFSQKYENRLCLAADD
ncbi:hypothetical protein, partial [Aeromonas caviae]